MSRLRLQTREYRTTVPEELARQLKERDAEVVSQFRAPLEPLDVADGRQESSVRLGTALMVVRDGSSLKVPTSAPVNKGQTFGIIVTGGSGNFILNGGGSAQIDGADSSTIASNGLRWYMSDGRGGWWRL